MPQPSKLHTRFVRQLLPLLVLAFVLSAASTTWFTHRSQLAHAEVQRSQTLVTLGAALVKPLWDCDGTTIQAVVQAMADQPNVRSVLVQDQCNATTWQAGTQAQGPDLHTLTMPLLYYASTGRSYSVGALTITFTGVSVRTSLTHNVGLQLVVFATMLAAVLTGAAWVFRRIIGRPLHRLREAMRAHQELTPIPAHWAEELAEITATYNTQVQELRRQARHDPLTGLGNRTLLEEHLQRAIRRAERTRALGHVLLLDLDRFKPINDTYGHAAGDAVLKTVAQRLLSCVRDTDTVARLGGDEFVVLTPDAPVEGSIQALAQRLRNAIEQPIDWNGRALQVRASIGVAQLLRDGTTSAALLASADAAMYAHKQQER